MRVSHEPCVDISAILWRENGRKVIEVSACYRACASPRKYVKVAELTSVPKLLFALNLKLFPFQPWTPPPLHPRAFKNEVIVMGTVLTNFTRPFVFDPAHSTIHVPKLYFEVVLVCSGMKANSHAVSMPRARDKISIYWISAITPNANIDVAVSPFPQLISDLHTFSSKQEKLKLVRGRAQKCWHVLPRSECCFLKYTYDLNVSTKWVIKQGRNDKDITRVSYFVKNKEWYQFRSCFGRYPLTAKNFSLKALCCWPSPQLGPWMPRSHNFPFPQTSAQVPQAAEFAYWSALIAIVRCTPDQPKRPPPMFGNWQCTCVLGAIGGVP